MKLDFIERCTMKTENPPAGSSRNSRTVTAATGSGMAEPSVTGLRLLLSDPLEFSTRCAANLPVGVTLGKISQRSFRTRSTDSPQCGGRIETNLKIRGIRLPL
jgi:hypothetical protein